MIKRYNVISNKWHEGFWVGSTFHIISVFDN